VFPQKPPADPKNVQKLLESHTPHETFEILAARIILANEGPRAFFLRPGPDREAQNQYHRTGQDRRAKDQAIEQGLGGSQSGTIPTVPAPLRRRGTLHAQPMVRRKKATTRSRSARDQNRNRGERMTKNKTREGPVPKADKGTNDKRIGLPTPTVQEPVTWVRPEPTTSNVTLPQQLSPNTTWSEPGVAKSKLAKGSPGLSTTRDQTKE
jgi:hypothetical protein